MDHPEADEASRPALLDQHIAGLRRIEDRHLFTSAPAAACRRLPPPDAGRCGDDEGVQGPNSNGPTSSAGAMSMASASGAMK